MAKIKSNAELLNTISSIQESLKPTINSMMATHSIFERSLASSQIIATMASIQESLKPTLASVSAYQQMIDTSFQTTGIAATMASIQESLKSFEFLSPIINLSFDNESILESKIEEIRNQFEDNLNLNEYMDVLLSNNIAESSEEKKSIDEVFQLLSEISPDFKILKNSIISTKYKRFFIVIMWLVILNFFNIYSFINQLSNNDVHYKSNCNNLRVRSTPTTETDNNIITKLNKNVYVEKIGSENKWVQVRFELSDGIEKEGWIYRTKLTKIED